MILQGIRFKSPLDCDNKALLLYLKGLTFMFCLLITICIINIFFIVLKTTKQFFSASSSSLL